MTRDPAIYGAATPTPHPALAGAAEVVVVETNDDDATVARCAEVAASRPVHGVLTTCDYHLATRAHAERLVASLRLRFADGSSTPPLAIAG